MFCTLLLPPFEVPRNAIGVIKRRDKYLVEVEFAGKPHIYLCAPEYGNFNKVLSRPFSDLLEKALRDFAAADAEFSRIVGDKPKAPTIDDDFRLKADAWRALPAKPVMPDEVHRQKVLAEAAIGEKDL
jgi:hypothetical protein